MLLEFKVVSEINAFQKIRIGPVKDILFDQPKAVSVSPEATREKTRMILSSECTNWDVLPIYAEPRIFLGVDETKEHLVVIELC